MHAAVMSALPKANAVIMAAAVADYRPAEEVDHKLKKAEGPLNLVLQRNPDILADLGAARRDKSPYLIGFALETEDLVQNARAKLERKKVDLIVANEAAVGFGGESNEVTLVTSTNTTALGRLSKREIADRILDHLRDHRIEAP